MFYYFVTVGCFFGLTLLFVVAMKGKRRRSRNTIQGGAVVFGLAAIFMSLFAALWIVHSFVAPLPLIGNLMSAYDPNVESWYENIGGGDFGELGLHDEDWRTSREGGEGEHYSNLPELQTAARGNIYKAMLLFMGTVVVVAALLMFAFKPKGYRVDGSSAPRRSRRRRRRRR